MTYVVARMKDGKPSEFLTSVGPDGSRHMLSTSVFGAMTFPTYEAAADVAGSCMDHWPGDEYRAMEYGDPNDERDINQMIDAIACRSDNLSGSALNTLHACRLNHPLGKGRKRSERFWAAHFMLRRPGVHTQDLIWLHRMCERFEQIEAKQQKETPA